MHEKLDGFLLAWALESICNPYTIQKRSVISIVVLGTYCFTWTACDFMMTAAQQEVVSGTGQGGTIERAAPCRECS
jgi:hypothetical protein